MDLRHARLGVLADASSCWPQKGKLLIDGLTYEGIAPGSPTDAKTRIDWLDRQYPPLRKRPGVVRPMREAFAQALQLAEAEGKKYRREWWSAFAGTLVDGVYLTCKQLLDWRQEKNEALNWLRQKNIFSPQPYSQLAKVLRNSGHTGDARAILVAREKARRKYGRMNLFARMWSLFLGATVGHGYRSWQAFLWLVASVILGAIFFAAGDANRLMVVSHERVYLHEDYNNTYKLPDKYPRFSSFVYSLDTFVPLVDLHQETYWRPLTTRWGGRWLRRYLWFHITFGWLLSFAVAAGITRAVRRDE